MSYFTKETGAQWEYTANWQTHKPYTAVETRMSQSRGAPWFPIKMIYPLVAWVGRTDRDPTTPITRSGYIP